MLGQRAAEGTGGVVSYANAYTLSQAFSDRSTAEALAHCDLCYPDGIGTVAALRLFGAGGVGKVSANYFFDDLAGSLPERGVRLALFGGRPGVAEGASARLRASFPMLRVDSCHGYASPQGQRAFLDRSPNPRRLSWPSASGSPGRSSGRFERAGSFRVRSSSVSEASSI